MTEHGRKLPPVTIRFSAPDPTAALAGVSIDAPGMGKFVAGAITGKVIELESAKPFDTVIGKEPGVSAFEDGTMAVR